jgi:uncharacterized protein with FMN-binding domain
LSAAVAVVGLSSALAGCATSEQDASYRDGDYTADGQYLAPSGTETIGVDLTITNDIITDVQVTPHATGGNQARFQQKFAGGIAAEIVGKDIDQLAIARVAGSTLTSGGFIAAIDSIKSEAIEP